MAVVAEQAVEEWCPYGAVCRVAPCGRGYVPRELLAAAAATELLLAAIAQQQLYVFVHRADRVPSSACICHGSHNTSSAMVTARGALSKHGFVCPHVTAYDDVALALSIPIDSIAQVYVTYRTAVTPAAPATPTATAAAGTTSAVQGKRVATRTKDLVIRTLRTTLWLEFEHNLARGWFLEALSQASASALPLEIEYLDLSDAAAIAAIVPATTAPEATTPSPPLAKLPAPSERAFLRDAWRHAIYEKTKLALQVAQDAGPGRDDATVPCLLTTAMELSTRLDEPDLNALTWLASGFLNLRPVAAASTPPSTATSKRELALAQVLHSLDVARQNSLEYVTCLALQCAASAFAQRPETRARARDALTQATRLLALSAACAAMEPPLKMQLRAALRELSAASGDSGGGGAGGAAGTTTTSARPAVQHAHSVLGGPASRLPVSARSRFRDDQRASAGLARSGSTSSLGPGRSPSAGAAAATSFSLWAHVFGGQSSGARPRGDSSVVAVDPVKQLLLVRVPKPLAGDVAGGSCFVDVLGAHGVHKAHFRVFFDAHANVAWLIGHVTKRYKLACAVAGDDDENDKDNKQGRAVDRVVVELVYDPQRKQLVAGDIVLCAWIPVVAAGEYTLHAKLAPRVVSSHRSVVSPPKPLPSTTKANTTAKEDASPDGSPSVLCSLCGRRIALSDVEGHSEACF